MKTPTAVYVYVSYYGDYGLATQKQGMSILDRDYITHSSINTKRYNILQSAQFNPYMDKVCGYTMKHSTDHVCKVPEVFKL